MANARVLVTGSSGRIGQAVVAELQARGVPVLKDMRLARFVLDPPRPLLRERIAARFAAMVVPGEELVFGGERREGDRLDLWARKADGTPVLTRCSALVTLD